MCVLRARTNDSFEHLTHVNQINIASNAQIARALCPMYLFYWKTLKLISVREVCVRSLNIHLPTIHLAIIAIASLFGTKIHTSLHNYFRRVFQPSDELHATSGSLH